MTASSQYSCWARYLLLISTPDTLQFQERDNIPLKLFQHILVIFLTNKPNPPQKKKNKVKKIKEKKVQSEI